MKVILAKQGVSNHVVPLIAQRFPVFESCKHKVFYSTLSYAPKSGPESEIRETPSISVSRYVG
jgi:hypothetical protein